jgi:hypothetical protein
MIIYAYCDKFFQILYILNTQHEYKKLETLWPFWRLHKSKQDTYTNIIRMDINKQYTNPDNIFFKLEIRDKHQ